MFRKFICRVFGHRFKTTQVITVSIAEVECVNCKKEFGINMRTQALLPLDDELRREHEAMLHGRYCNRTN